MTRTAAVIGGGPAGLMAAEVLSVGGVAVTVYDGMPSLGRKFLMAGRGGLNLTHSEPLETLVTRYGAASSTLRPLLEAFSPAALVAWAEGLGQPTFTGSSGRIFPKTMKASPLLRAWLARLREQRVDIRTHHHWVGWNGDGGLCFGGPEDDPVVARPDVTVLALGGASWPKLGSTGSWTTLLQGQGVGIADLKPANSGFTVSWSDHFRARFEGQPLKHAAFRFSSNSARGDAVVTRYGIEGGAIYALSAGLREEIEARGKAILEIDLRPEIPQAQLALKLQRPRKKGSVANHLRKTVALSPLEIGLLREIHGAGFADDATVLAKRIKTIPVTLTGARSLARAISTAGGVAFASLDGNLMLRARPGVFVAGEMLDWEAPTGGYLLQACFATGVAAAKGALAWLEDR